MQTKKVTIGFIPANRSFFSDKLAAKMRKDALATLRAAGARVVVPSASDTKVGCVFHESRVQGVVIGAVNFGDEQGVAAVMKEFGRRVPILIFGCQEEQVLTPTSDRRDSFCGLLSIGEALRQMQLPYSVPEVPICFPTDESFRGSVERFLAVVRVVPIRLVC